MTMASLIVPTLLLPLASLPSTYIGGASAFIAIPTPWIRPIPHLLSAKKKKPATAASSGGFGRVATNPTSSPKKKNEPFDYDAPLEFPPLEKEIAATLIPATPQDLPGMDLPTEIYAQIGQAHGFNRFNFLKGLEDDDKDPVDGTQVEEVVTNEDEDGSSLSFEDLLGAATGGPKIDVVSAFASKKSPARAPADIKSLIKAATNAVKNDADGALRLEPAAATDPAAESASASVARAVSLLPPFPHLEVLHRDPLVLSVPDFLPAAACERMIDVSRARSRAPGTGAHGTSSTFYHAYRDVPELLAAACRLFGLVGAPGAGTPLRPGETYAMGVCEEPQTVRYAPGHKFTCQLDALPPGGEAAGRGGAGQRTATLRVYLNDVAKEHGGGDTFRDLGIGGEPLVVQPKKGSALIFFPAAGGFPSCPFDVRTVHSGEAMKEDTGAEKWIAQLWLREGPYRPIMEDGEKQISHWDATEGIQTYCEAQK